MFVLKAGIIRGLGGGLCAAAALMLAACAATPTDGPAPAVTSTAKLSDVFATPDWAKFTGASNRPLVQRTVTPDDLISAEGRCAGAPEQASAMAATDGNAPGTTAEALQGQGALPTVSGGIALAMTECQVAQRAGTPERVEIGSEGTERTVVLTYMQGQWPGIYRFRSGRLASIERVEAPPPVKPKPAARNPAAKSAPAPVRITPRG